MTKGIRVVNAFEVETDIGKCFIDLCIGDITALPKQDEVDVLVLSAFPGDYNPTPSSLIGQLSIRLGISVRQLAKDKEEDLRKLYSCWWSKPLPNHLSFRKILCFEGGRNTSTSIGQVVGDVFRCLVPILANNEGKVIMPILASGDQRKSKTKMLKLLVDAAVHWMKAGLPLRSLKIVIFSRDIDNISKADQPLFDLFQELKSSHEQEELQKEEQDEVESKDYDIYLSYSEEDVKCVDEIVDVLLKNRSNIRVYTSIQKLDLETSWQTQLYDVIKKCKRVMALITPSFLESTRCTEQYNIALCHSRKTQESVLMPLYVTDVPYMPTYMRITQYIDCRISFQEKLNAACITVIGSLTCETIEVTTKDDTRKPSKQDYDIFLSYSHCNSDRAKQIMNELRHQRSDLNIFIDTAELKAGGAWQLTLYTALNRSRFVIALISNDYLHSKVCNEEICLSIALQLQDKCKIWPIVIEPLKANIDWLNMLSPVNFYDDNGEKNNSMSFLCNNFLMDMFEGSAGNPVLSEKNCLQTCLEESRSFFFGEEFISLVECEVVRKEEDGTSAFLPKDQSCNVDIYIICSSEDIESCSLLQNIITSQSGLDFIVKVSTDENASTRLTYLDKARLVIPLLSGSFMQCSELVHELNIAWCRQRDCSSLCFLAIVIEQLPNNPTYVSLFPCFFNCGDDRWVKDRETLKLFSSDELTRVYKNCQCPLSVVLCFMTVVDHIQRWNNGSRCPVLGIHNKLFNCLHLNAYIQQRKEILSKCNEEPRENQGSAVVSSDSHYKMQQTLPESCSSIVPTPSSNLNLIEPSQLLPPDEVDDFFHQPDSPGNATNSLPYPPGARTHPYRPTITSGSSGACSTEGNDKVTTGQSDEMIRTDNDDSSKPSEPTESQTSTAKKGEARTVQGDGMIRADIDHSSKQSGTIESQNQNSVKPQEIKNPDESNSDVKLILSQQIEQSNIENISRKNADDLGKETTVESRDGKRAGRKNDPSFSCKII